MNTLARSPSAQPEDLAELSRRLQTFPTSLPASAQPAPAPMPAPMAPDDTGIGAPEPAVESPVEERGEFSPAYRGDRFHPPPVLPFAPPRPAAPPAKPEDLPWDEVALGLRPSEAERAARDPAFAAELAARHRRYADRIARGDAPLEARDYEFWRWQRTMERSRPAKTGLWTKYVQLQDSMAEGAVTMARQGWKFGVEMLYLEMKSRLSPEDYVEAQRARADIGTVAVAKALAGNIVLARTALDLNDRAATSIAKLFDSPERAEFYDELHDRYLYDSAQKNHDDNKTAENFNRDILAPLPALSVVLGHTEVDPDVSDFASNFVDVTPASKVKRLAKGLGARLARTETTSALRAGMKPPVGVIAHPGEFKAAQEALAAQRGELARAQATHDALLVRSDPAAAHELARARGKVVTLDLDIAAREEAIATGRARAAEEMGTLTRAARDMREDLRAAGPAGEAAATSGALAEKLAALPPALSERVAPGSTFSRHAAQVPPAASAAELASPTLRRLRRAEVASGFSGPAASLVVDPVSASLQQVKRAGANAARDALHSAVAGGVLGALTDPEDSVTGFMHGFGANGVLGAGQGVLGQWRVYASPAHVRLEQAGRRRAFRAALEMRPDQVKHFDRLPEELQNSIAHYSAANPDAKLVFIDDPHRLAGAVDSLDRSTVTINVADRDPVRNIVKHEVAHTTEGAGMGAAIDRQLLGDATVDLPGDYTLRDADGRPVKTADGLAYATNAEFARLRSHYIESFVADVQSRGWSPEKISAEVERFDNRYIAREIYAEQFAAYLTTSSYRYDLLGGPRAGYFTPSDLLRNSTVLQNTLGRFGFVFDDSGGIVHSPLFGDYRKSPAIDRLVREYVRVQSDGHASGATRPPGESIPRPAPSREIVEKYLADSPTLARDAEGRPLYDEQGRVRLRPPEDIASDAARVANTLADHLDTAADARLQLRETAVTPDSASLEPPPHPDAVQRRAAPDGERYTGRFLDENALEALADSGHLSPAEFDQLDRLNTALRDSEGRGVALTRFELADPAQPRTQRDTGIPGHWRSEIVTGLEITRDGSIALQTLAPEALRRTAAELAASDDGWRWLRDPGAIVRDLYTDAQHRLTARPSNAILTGNAAAKSALIEQAFGTTRTPDGGPPSTVSSGLQTTSIPLHDLNRALVVEAEGEIGTQYSPRPRVISNRGARGTPRIKGGAHRNVRGFAGHESHHIPPKSISFLSEWDGPAITMTKEDHFNTTSYGNSTDAQKFRAKQKALMDRGDFEGAQRMDFDDIRARFGKKYDAHIKELEAYTKQLRKDGKL